MISTLGHGLCDERMRSYGFSMLVWEKGGRDGELVRRAGKREVEGTACGQEFGEACTCIAWYEMVEKGMGAWSLCRVW